MSATPLKKVPIHLQSSQNRLLIKNGRVVNEDRMEDTDVYIEDGIIKQVGRNLIIPGGTRVIDAAGKLVMPGGVDPHTHLELEMMGAKTCDDFYKGTRAAVAGGTTTIIDFVLPNKGQSLLEAYHNWRSKADKKVCCDYALHVGVTWWSAGVQREMRQLCEEFGVNSFKMFMAYRDAWMLDDYELMAAMEACVDLHALPQVHAENGHIIARNTEKLLAAGVRGPIGHALSRDEEVEAEAVNRACVIANQAKAPLYIVHMMSASAVRTLQAARSRGPLRPIFGETLAATIGTDGSHYRNACFRHAAAHVLSPPLRLDPTTPDYMIEALAHNDLQVTASDHCTFTAKDKELGKDNFSKIPNGVNGLEDRMAVLWQKAVNTGVMDPCRFVSVTSTAAAKIFNLYPQKGAIAVNSDADIVVWDPKLSHTISAASHHHAVDFNIFEGLQVVGGPQYVIVGGRVCVDDGALRVVEGHGRFLKSPVGSPYVYGDMAPETPKEEPIAKVTNGNGPPQELKLVNKLLDEVSVCSSASTPTGRKMRTPEQRDLQSSSFSISKEVEGLESKTSVRVRNPPGGKSSGLW